MGTPSTKLKNLRDGFYLEIRNRNSKIGVKIRRDSKDQLLRTIEMYKKSKDIIVLGKIENGKMITIQ
ncbi:MAG: hypothetical protein COB12_04310 [Flavobacterium sp.]|nr:MAG: hypothetical protein COB12_04310 [Flavobacterium sp.]